MGLVVLVGCGALGWWMGSVGGMWLEGRVELLRRAGTPAQVAEQINEHVQTDAADGFILVPHLTPGGLDDFVDAVVPELQERGVFRSAYTGTTLRDHLSLSAPRASAARALTR